MEQHQHQHAAPPGRVVRYFDDDPAQMARILAAVAGLRARLVALREETRAGSPAYHSLSREIGELTTIEAQCARALDPQSVAETIDALHRAEKAGEQSARMTRR